MPRFYVKNKENKWNIFSTIIDDFLFDDFIEFDDLVFKVCAELVEDKKKELQTLLTNNPKLNTMSYEKALERLEDKNKND